MKPNPMITLADAVNDRRRTTAALSLLVDLIEHADRTDGPDFAGLGSARADLLGIFVEKMRASDELQANLIREAAPYIE